MRLQLRRFGWMFRLLGLLLAGAVFIASITPSGALAQSTGDPWDEPQNLSRSGVAINPGFVMDSSGIGHAIWQDDQEKFQYSRFDGEQWSEPKATDLDRLFTVPFETTLTYSGPNPLFLPSPGREVIAFWINRQDKLYSSKVNNVSFDKVAGWGSGHFIAPEVGSFGVAFDAVGELHLAYVRTIEDSANPAGIYYTRSKNGGLNWSASELLYESTYFRGLAPSEANVSVSTVETEDGRHIYIAFDNRHRKQVLLVQSVDGGENWKQPVLIAGPTPDSGAAGPFNIHVATKQNSVVLVWQHGQPEGTCSQIYQASIDAGTTWSDPQSIIDDILGCAQSNEFVMGSNDPESPLYFLAETKNQSFLTAWNGSQWSEPQLQPILSGFEEPEIYTQVIYGCHRASLFADKLYVVGCDEGDGGDVWATARELNSEAAFEPPIWTELSSITNENIKIEAVELVSTDDGLIHAFFSQHQDPEIYYTYWDGELWSRVTGVLELPEGTAGWPAIASGPGNELFLVARNDAGELYFNRANSGDAARGSRWSTPTRLEIDANGEIGSVDVAWDAVGTIYVAYSVPVNDKRGVYLIQSKDHGATWSEPLQVFDGAVAGSDLVGAPSLLITEKGVLHLIWTQQSVQGDGVPQSLSLYYARSEDGGQTFNVAAPVVEEPVAWREIVADGKGNLHLLWQPQETMTTVWDQISFDGGQTWQSPQGLPDPGTTAAVTVDSGGRLHLVNSGPGSLGHWLWDGKRWQAEEPHNWSLTAQRQSPAASLAAAVNKQGKMVVVLAIPAGETDQTEQSLLYSIRTLDLPSGQNPIKEIPTQTVTPPTLAAATSTSDSATAVAESTVESQPTIPQSQTPTASRLSPLTIALLPVALLLLGVMGFVIRRAARAKDR